VETIEASFVRVVFFVLGVLLAAILLGRIIRERNRANELARDRSYFKRNYR
jgi:hypothetical protein